VVLALVEAALDSVARSVSAPVVGDSGGTDDGRHADLGDELAHGAAVVGLLGNDGVACSGVDELRSATTS
jgi:hypothetical protein